MFLENEKNILFIVIMEYYINHGNSLNGDRRGAASVVLSGCEK